MDITWSHPFNCLVSAPTKSGKTEFVKKLVINLDNIVSPAPRKIYWCYTEWQNTYEDLKMKCPNVQILEGMPDFELLKSHPNIPKLLIMYDMMEEMKKDSVALNRLFTRGSHHWNLSIIHIIQNLFYQGGRTSRINAQYIVLLYNPADRLQVQTLGRQLFPSAKNYFEEAFIDATNEPYGYMLIDLNPATPDNCRLRTGIFPDDIHYVYTLRVQIHKLKMVYHLQKIIFQGRLI